jgi:hypothetical protein
VVVMALFYLRVSRRHPDVHGYTPLCLYDIYVYERRYIIPYSTTGLGLSRESHEITVALQIYVVKAGNTYGYSVTVDVDRRDPKMDLFVENSAITANSLYSDWSVNSFLCFTKA